jgi:hypothetical protein
MNAACLARLRQLEMQLAPRRDDTEERRKLIDEIMQEIERHAEPGRPEPTEEQIAAIEAVLEQCARGCGR